VERNWSFFTNHLEVLVAIDGNRDIRLRDLAVRVGVTERTAQGIVADLTKAGYLSVRRVGRRNTYEVNRCMPVTGRPEPVSNLLGALAGGHPPDRADA
jgi:uncharacterized membrane protein